MCTIIVFKFIFMSLWFLWDGSQVILVSGCASHEYLEDDPQYTIVLLVFMIKQILLDIVDIWTKNISYIPSYYFFLLMS